MITISQAGPPVLAISRATVRACHSASALPRVPILMTRYACRPSAAPRRHPRTRRGSRRTTQTGGSTPPSTARRGARPRASFSCSVGCSSSFSTMSRVISSTRARALPAAAPPASARAARARTCGWSRSGGAAPRLSAPLRRDRCQVENCCTSSSTICSARPTSAVRALEVLPHDRLQVVDVVEKHLLDFAGPRVDVARHRNVDEKQRPHAAGRHGRLDLGLGENRGRRARDRDDDVRFEQRLRQRVPGRHVAADFVGELLGVRQRAAGDDHSARRPAP